MPKKIKSNVDLVNDMMEFSNFGALSQMFIIDAISKLAKAVAAAKPEDVDTPLIPGTAWVGVAKEIKTRMDKFYGRIEEDVESCRQCEKPLSDDVHSADAAQTMRPFHPFVHANGDREFTR